jgi:PBP1b-binding outer membrane lipoprotein LpoB
MHSIVKIAVLAAFLGGCSAGPASFTSKKVEQANFANYKTFAFLPTNDTAYTKLISRQNLEPMLARQAVAVL